MALAGWVMPTVGLPLKHLQARCFGHSGHYQADLGVVDQADIMFANGFDGL